MLSLPLAVTLLASLLNSPTIPEGCNLQKRHAQLLTVKSVAVVLPDPEIEVWDLRRAGKDRNDILSKRANKVLRECIGDALKKKGLTSSIVEVKESSRSQIREISELSEKVLWSMERHTCERTSAEFIPQRVIDFNYQIGSVRAVTDQFHADAVLCLYGYSEAYRSDRSNRVPVKKNDLKNNENADGDAAQSDEDSHSSYYRLRGVLVDKDGAVLWAGDVRFNYASGMFFESSQGMLPGLDFLFHKDIWEMEWNNQSGK